MHADILMPGLMSGLAVQFGASRSFAMPIEGVAQSTNIRVLSRLTRCRNAVMCTLEAGCLAPPQTGKQHEQQIVARDVVGKSAHRLVEFGQIVGAEVARARFDRKP